MRHLIDLPDISASLTANQSIDGATIPPRSTRELAGKIVEYHKGKSIVSVYPVEERFTNPMGILQGGILTAMFDDTIGWLTYAATGKPVVSTGFNVQFIRGVHPDCPGLIIRAAILSKSRQTLLVTAEASTIQGKLLAIMHSHNLILRDQTEPPAGPCHDICPPHP